MSSHQFPFFDRAARRSFLYDQANDIFVYQDGTSRPRPADVEPPDIPRMFGTDRQRQDIAPAASAYSQGQTHIPTAGSRYSSRANSSLDPSYTYGTVPTAASPPRASAQPLASSRQQNTRDAHQEDAQELSRAFGKLDVTPSRGGTAQRGTSISSQDRDYPGQYQEPLHSQYRRDPQQRQNPPAGEGSLGPLRQRIVESGGLQIIETYNPNSDVTTLIAPDELNPIDRITDSSLLQNNIRARGLLVGSGRREGEQERLYSTFRVKSHSFFVVGRVFLVLWVEPAGTTAVTNVERNDSFLPGRYQDEFIFSKVRRFVVIRAGELYCSALPVVSYGHQGVGKTGVIKSEHAIMYTGAEPSPLASETPRRGETGMRHTAIRVVPDDPTDKLDPVSRIDFGKVHTVQHNIKVKAFGMVHPAFMSALQTQFINAWYGDTMTSAILTPTSARASEPSRAGPSPVMNFREARPELNAPVRPVPRPAPVAPHMPQAGATTTGQASGSRPMTGQHVADAGQRTSQSRQTPNASSPSDAARSRGASSVASTGTRRQAQQTSAVQEASGSEEDDEEEQRRRGQAPSSADAQAQVAEPAPQGQQSASEMAAEARSCQAAYQGLRRRGFSYEQAFALLVQRFAEQRPGIPRAEAGAAITRRLRYQG